MKFPVSKKTYAEKLQSLKNESIFILEEGGCFMGFPLLHILTENSAGESGIKTEDVIRAVSRMKADTVAVADYACIDAFLEMCSRADTEGIKVLCAVSADYRMQAGCSVPDTPVNSGRAEDAFRIVLIAKDKTGYGQICGILSDAVSFDRDRFISCVTDAGILGKNISETGHLICLTGGIDGISRLFMPGSEGNGEEQSDAKTGPARSIRDINSDITKEKDCVASLERETAELSMTVAIALENGTGADTEKKVLKDRKKELSSARKRLSTLKAEKKEYEKKKSGAGRKSRTGLSPADTALLELKGIFGENLFLELSPDILPHVGEIMRLSREHSVSCAVTSDAVTLSGAKGEQNRLSVIRQGAGHTGIVLHGNECKRRPYTEEEMYRAFPGVDEVFLTQAVSNAERISMECENNVPGEREDTVPDMDVSRLVKRLESHVADCERELYGTSMDDLLYISHRFSGEDGKKPENSTFHRCFVTETAGRREIRVKTTRRALENAVLRLSQEGFRTTFIMEKEKTDIREAFITAGKILSGSGGRAGKETSELSGKINAYLDSVQEENRTIRGVLNEIRSVFGKTPAYDRIADTVKILFGVPTGRYLYSGKAFIFERGEDKEGQPAVLCGAEGVPGRVLPAGTDSPGGIAVVPETGLYTEILMLCAGSIRGKTDFSQMFLSAEKKDVFDRIYSAGNTLFTPYTDTEETMRAWEKIRPQTMDDTGAGIVLAGAGGNMPLYSYVKRKNEKEYVNYRFDSLRAITGPTFGRFLYEDQITDGICAVTGYTAERALNTFSVMRDADRTVSDRERDDFVQACVQKALSGSGQYRDDAHTAAEDAREVFNDMRRASRYVRKREEVLYETSLSYACAYMKLRHPSEYMAAVLAMTQWKEHASVFAECGRMGLRILLPDINRAHEKPVVTADGDIICGFGCIAGFDADTEAVIRERENGVYRGIVDFIKRTGTDEKNTGLLIKAGSFDFETGDRRAMKREAGAVLRTAESRKKTAEKLHLLEMSEKTERTELEIRSAKSRLAQLDEKLSSVFLPKCGADPNTNAKLEKEVLGAVVGAHPLDGCMEAVPGAESTNEVKKGKRIVLAGIVRNAETRRTVSENREMCAFLLEDKNGTAKIMAFPECFEQYGADIKNGAVVRVCGVCMEDRADPGSVIVAAGEVTRISGLVKPVVVDACMPGWEKTAKKHASVYGHPVILLRNGLLEVIPLLVDGGILDEDPDHIRECYTVFPL